MGLYIICQLNTEDMLDSLLAFLVFHREHDFYTFVQISRHPVCTSHINIFPAIIIVIKNSAVLKKITYDGTHMDILAESRNPGFQTADASNDQVYLYTCTGSFIKCCNNLRITQRIHLRNNPRSLSFFGMLRLPLNQL